MSDDNKGTDSKRLILAGLAALGVLALGAVGVLQIDTTECAKCKVDYAVAMEKISYLEKDLHRLDARVTVQEKAVDACEAALNGGN